MVVHWPTFVNERRHARMHAWMLIDRRVITPGRSSWKSAVQPSAGSPELKGLTRFVIDFGLRDAISKFQHRRHVRGKWRCSSCAGPAHACQGRGQPGPCQDGPAVKMQTRLFKSNPVDIPVWAGLQSVQ